MIENKKRKDSLYDPNQYVESIVKKHKLPGTIDNYTDSTVVTPLKNIISNWAGTCLCDIKLSGSRAKGTAIDIATDLDLFISLSSTTSNTLKEIYDSLYDCMIRQGITARKQNVSIGITYQNKDVDLVPAKRQGQLEMTIAYISEKLIHGQKQILINTFIK